MRGPLLTKSPLLTIQASVKKKLPAEIPVRPANPFRKFNREELERSVPERFEAIVSQSPNSLALTSKNRRLTYDELNRAANRVARAILDSTSEGERPVALLLNHDTPMVVAMMGALKAGKIYVPLDPSLPAPRIKAMLEDAQAELVVTDDAVVSLAD
jgi:surfactin family lipopeptide synthetase A